MLTPAAAQDDLTQVRVVLQWVTQAQFAGYYAADALGYYEELGLDVEIIPGGPDISADQIVAAGEAEFGVRPFLTTLAAREGGADFVSIAWVNQIPPHVMVSFKEAGIETVEDMRGRTIGSWLGGNEPEQFAMLRMYEIEPDVDVTIIKQGFDMSQLLNGEVEAAQATIYNEYAQLLETTNPETGELYSPDDFNTISIRQEGIVTLQDSIFARESWLAEEGNEAVAVAFIEASLKGWIYCRDNSAECVNIILDAGSLLGESHQTWMLNEFNNLIWPAPNGIGNLNNGDEFEQSVEIGLTYGIITEEPDEGTWRTDLVAQATENLIAGGLDVYGLDFEKAVVELRPGGE
jgi:NitT/TauT family transport system substrate-binding protein